MHPRRRCRQRRCSIDLRDATWMMLLGDPDRLVARSSMLSPGPPPAQRDDPARRRARSSNACYLYRRCQVKLCGSLGSWLTVVIDFKRWRGMDTGQTRPPRLGPSRTANPAHRLPILPVAANSDADGMSPASPRCRYRAFRASLSLSRNSPSLRKQRVRFLQPSPQASVPVSSRRSVQAALKPKPRKAGWDKRMHALRCCSSRCFRRTGE